MVKNLPASPGDQEMWVRSLGESERSPGGGHCTPLQYSCLENFRVRGACQVTVYVDCKESDTTEHASACSHTHRKENARLLLVRDTPIMQA